MTSTSIIASAENVIMTFHRGGQRMMVSHCQVGSNGSASSLPAMVYSPKIPLNERRADRARHFNNDYEC